MELFVERLGQIINLSQDGQIEMAELIRPISSASSETTQACPSSSIRSRGRSPRGINPRSVVIDPRVSFGRPVIVGTGIPTAALAEQFKAGDLPAVLAKEYGASEEAIWDAIRCELDLQAA